MATAKPVIKTPTTIEEFRRLANAFITGSAFPAGHLVYIVASTSGMRPVQAVIDAKSPTADRDVAAALALDSPRGFTREEAASRVIYQIEVPRVDDLSRVLDDPDSHGWSEDGLMLHRSGSAPKVSGAFLGDIASVALHITWKDTARGTTIYDALPHMDALFLTEGAVEAFLYPFYASVYGQTYVERLKKKRRG